MRLDVGLEGYGYWRTAGEAAKGSQNGVAG